MKRVFFVSAMALILVVSLWGSAFSRDHPTGWEDPAGGGDDHPWGGEQRYEEPSTDFSRTFSPGGYLPPALVPIDFVMDQLGVYRWFISSGIISTDDPKSRLNRESTSDNSNQESRRSASGR